MVFSAQAFTIMLASPILRSLADRHRRERMVERSIFGGAVVILGMAFVGVAMRGVIP